MAIRFRAEGIKNSGGKLGKAAGLILPIFSRESVYDFTRKIIDEDHDIRRAVEKNPQYRAILEDKVRGSLKKYREVIIGSKVIDSWDRVTSAAGLAADALGPVSAGLGNAFSAVEEIAEGIPKAAYMVYYLKKTGDKKAVYYWTAGEAASFIPYVGDAIDMTNMYLNKVREFTRNRAKEEFKRMIKLSPLERDESDDIVLNE